MVLLRSQVQEWVQPAPTVTSGEAGVSFSCVPTVVVSGLAQAAAGISGFLLVSVGALGAAVFEGTGEVQLRPDLSGVAIADFDNTGSTSPNVAVRVAAADVGIIGLCLGSVECLGQGGVVVVPEADAAVEQLGSASVSIEYYGNGDTPIFPFSLPFLFLPEGFDNCDAAALIDFEGTADFAVGGEAAAVVIDVDASGDFVLLGSIPIFPFQLPAAFDSLGAKNRGVAQVVIVGDADSVIAVDGFADLDVSAVGTYISGSLLPFSFPFLFDVV